MADFAAASLAFGLTDACTAVAGKGRDLTEKASLHIAHVDMALDACVSPRAYDCVTVGDLEQLARHGRGQSVEGDDRRAKEACDGPGGLEESLYRRAPVLLEQSLSKMVRDLRVAKDPGGRVEQCDRLVE